MEVTVSQSSFHAPKRDALYRLIFAFSWPSGTARFSSRWTPLPQLIVEWMGLLHAGATLPVSVADLEGTIVHDKLTYAIDVRYDLSLRIPCEVFEPPLRDALADLGAQLTAANPAATESAATPSQSTK